MPKAIEIPGAGVVEFPSEMPDDEIKAVIKRKFFTKTATEPLPQSAHDEAADEPTVTATNQPPDPRTIIETGIKSATALTDAVVGAISSPAAGEASKEGRAQLEAERNPPNPVPPWMRPRTVEVPVGDSLEGVRPDAASPLSLDPGKSLAGDLTRRFDQPVPSVPTIGPAPELTTMQKLEGVGRPMFTKSEAKAMDIKRVYGKDDMPTEEFVREHPETKFAIFGFMGPTDMPAPRLTTQEAESLFGKTVGGYVSGAQQGVADFVDFATSAPGIMTAMTGGVAGLATKDGATGIASTIHRGTTYAFAADMARHMPEQFGAVVDAIERGDTAEATRGILGSIVTLAIISHAAKNKVTPGPKLDQRVNPDVIANRADNQRRYEQIARVAPLTAKALAETEVTGRDLQMPQGTVPIEPGEIGVIPNGSRTGRVEPAETGTVAELKSNLDKAKVETVHPSTKALGDLMGQRNRLFMEELPKHAEGTNGRARVLREIADLDKQAQAIIDSNIAEANKEISGQIEKELGPSKSAEPPSTKSKEPPPARETISAGEAVEVVEPPPAPPETNPAVAPPPPPKKPTTTTAPVEGVKEAQSVPEGGLFSHLKDIVKKRASERDWSKMPQSFEADAVSSFYEREIKDHIKTSIAGRVKASKAQTFDELISALDKAKEEYDKRNPPKQKPAPASDASPKQSVPAENKARLEAELKSAEEVTSKAAVEAEKATQAWGKHVEEVVNPLKKKIREAESSVFQMNTDALRTKPETKGKNKLTKKALMEQYGVSTIDELNDLYKKKNADWSALEKELESAEQKRKELETAKERRGKEWSSATTKAGDLRRELYPKVREGDVGKQSPSIDTGKLGEAKPDTRTPIEILNQSSRIKVVVPDGATQVRITDSKGRKSVMPLSDVNKGDNPFRSSGAVKVEAGTIGKDKQFVPMNGEVKVADKATPKEDALQRSSKSNDAFDRAQKGDESAFDDLENQFREIYPEPEQLEAGRRNPNQVHTPQAFETLFNRAFGARDFETILDAIKASDVGVWKPMMKDLFSKQAKDPLAATKVDWFRHVFNGTVPPDAIPRPAPRPSATPPPRPGPTPPRPSGPPPPPPSHPPVRIPVEPITGGTPKSPFQIIKDFSEAIGKAIRVLRMKKNGLGVYRPGSTLTAEKFAGDLDTAAHELAGHWTDDKYGIGKPWVTPRTRSPYDTELAKFWIHGSVTPRSSLSYRRAEGIAEFIRAYVVNPKQAKLDAPTFAAYFERTLPPEALKAINDFGTDVRTWAGADPLLRAGLNIRMEPPTLTEKLWKGITGRGFGFEINPVDWLRQRFDDPYHYAMKADDAIQKLRGGISKPYEKSFSLMARLLATHDKRMSNQFENGLLPLRPKQALNAKGKLDVVYPLDTVTQQPKTLKWLMGVFDTKNNAVWKQDMRDASAFMVAERTVEKAKQLGRQENVSGIGAGIISDVQAAKELLARVAKDPAKEAQLKEAARRYRVWADDQIQMLVDSGRLSPERAREIRDSNQYYVDMHRLSEEFEVANYKTRGGGIGTAKDVIRRFKGSTLELDNVYTNLMGQTEAIQKEAHRNVVMNNFVDGLRNVRELHGPNLKDFDQFGRKVTSADRNTITVYKDGKTEHWQFAPEVFESLKGLGELQTNALFTFAMMPSQFARYMITRGPSFMVRNPLRDTFERSVNSRSGGKPWDIFQGYSKAELNRYEVFGGGQFGNYIVNRLVWHREVKRVMRELTKDPTNIFLSPLKLKHAWEALGEKSETLGRIAEFRRAFEIGKKKMADDHPGLTPDEINYNAALYAAGEARGLMDFAKAGTVMRYINQAIPFSNPGVRGLAKSIYGMKENPARYAMNWGLYVLAPTLAVMMLNRRDDETWKEYMQMPAYRRDFFWNLKVGSHWWIFPKPHLLGVLAGGVERIVAGILGEPHPMEGLGASLANTLPVSNLAESSGPLKTFLELNMNRDTFRDRDIVPVWERDLSLDLRKGTKYASGTGRGIAHALNSSGLGIDPRQVDHVLNSMGGWGNIATSSTKPNADITESAIKATGIVIEPPGVNAQDVQWVIDWARKNGKMQTSSIRKLQTLRKAVMEERDAKGRYAKSKELIAYAKTRREQIEKSAASAKDAYPKLQLRDFLPSSP